MPSEGLWFPSYRDVVEIHKLILEDSGGEPGILSPGTILSAVERTRWGPFPGSGDIWERAAFLLRGIAQDHPFVDGNKRTAIEAADAFLGRNGWRLTVEEDAFISFIATVAMGERELQQIATWLRSNSEKR